MLTAVLLVLGYIAFEVDIFLTEGSASSEQKKIELDEALLLGGILAVGMLIFSLRRYSNRSARRRGASPPRDAPASLPIKTTSRGLLTAASSRRRSKSRPHRRRRRATRMP